MSRVHSQLAAVAIVAFAAAVLALFNQAGAAAVPSGGVLDFTVLRDGDAVGHDVLRFTQDGDQLDVTVKTDVAVKIAFITAYRFKHEGHETWRGGRLVSLSSTTNDDGTAHKLSVQADGSLLRIQSEKGNSTAPSGIVPASLWNENIVKGGAALNTLDGTQMLIKVTDAGWDEIAVHGQKVKAHHYVISGDLQRELWYDQSGVLARVRFKAKDDSTVVYALRN